MRTFEYRGYDANGRSCRGLVEGHDLKDARERLATRDVFPEELHPAGDQLVRRFSKRGVSFGIEVRAMLYRELSALLLAGLPLAAAMQVLIDAPEIGDARQHLAGIRDRIRDGASLARALEDGHPGVAAFEIAVVEAGERAGTLDVVLERLAGFLEEQARLRDRVVSALVYPSIVVAAAIIIGAVTLGILIPRIGVMLASANIPLPTLTLVVIGIARVFPFALMALTAAALIVFGVAKANQGFRESLRRKGASLVPHIPVVAVAQESLIRLRFARTLAMLVRGGVGMVEAVTLAGRATGNQTVAARAAEVSETVKHGANLADALRAAPVLGESLPGWIQAGEASGRLPELLDSAAGRFQQQWERRVTRALSVAEPLLILLVSAFVLLIALAILMPILSLNQALQ